MFVANVSMLYGDQPVLERPAAAAADGYQTIETWWPFPVSVPADAQVARWVEAVQQSGVRLHAMNFTLGDDGERGILSHPARAAEFGEHCDVVAGIVNTLGIRFCNAPYGLRDGSDADTALANLVLASSHLQPLGAMPMLEPMSGIPDFPLTTAAQAVAVIEQVGVPVGLLADLYHFAANGEDIDAVLRTHIQKIVHVQVADFPGRHEPGTGTLDIDGYLTLLNNLGYHGEVALEYIPGR